MTHAYLPNARSQSRYDVNPSSSLAQKQVREHQSSLQDFHVHMNQAYRSGSGGASTRAGVVS